MPPGQSVTTTSHYKRNYNQSADFKPQAALITNPRKRYLKHLLLDCTSAITSRESEYVCEWVGVCMSVLVCLAIWNLIRQALQVPSWLRLSSSSDLQRASKPIATPTFARAKLNSATVWNLLFQVNTTWWIICLYLPLWFLLPVLCCYFEYPVHTQLIKRGISSKAHLQLTNIRNSLELLT